MIDFRYHLVSIVSIFLALAVGIVLGAGPLKGELGDTLNKEVAGLRQDKADLNKQLRRPGRLRGARRLHRRDQPDHARRRAPGPPGRARRAPRRGCRGVRGDRRHPALVRRGRGVDDLGVSEDWVTSDEATAASRDAAVTAAARPRPGSTSPTAGRWPRATCCSPACSPCRPTTRRRRSPPATAQKALDALASADLIKIDTEGFELADLVVVVSGVTTQGDGDARQQAAERWVDLVIALDTRSSGSLVAAEATTAGNGVSVIETVRNDATATKGVSTVDNAGGAMGQASVVHALKEQAAGDVGQYGLAPRGRRTLRTHPGVVSRVATLAAGALAAAGSVRRAPRAHGSGALAALAAHQPRRRPGHPARGAGLRRRRRTGRRHERAGRGGRGAGLRGLRSPRRPRRRRRQQGAQGATSGPPRTGRVTTGLVKIVGIGATGLVAAALADRGPRRRAGPRHPRRWCRGRRRREPGQPARPAPGPGPQGHRCSASLPLLLGRGAARPARPPPRRVPRSACSAPTSRARRCSATPAPTPPGRSSAPRCWAHRPPRPGGRARRARRADPGLREGLVHPGHRVDPRACASSTPGAGRHDDAVDASPPASRGPPG